MKPIDFPEYNARIQRSSGEVGGDYDFLPIYRDGGQCISCWKLSLRERLSVLLFGKVWIWVMAGNTQPPISLMVTDNIFDGEQNE